MTDSTSARDSVGGEEARNCASRDSDSAQIGFHDPFTRSFEKRADWTSSWTFVVEPPELRRVEKAVAAAMEVGSAEVVAVEEEEEERDG